MSAADLFAARPPLRNKADAAVLVLHGCMLDHGFICLCAGGAEKTADRVSLAPDGSIVRQILPSAWNSQEDSYSFVYSNPLRRSLQPPDCAGSGCVVSPRDAETPDSDVHLKAVLIGDVLAVHAVAKKDSAGLLSAEFDLKDLPAISEDGSYSRVPKAEKRFKECIISRLLQGGAASVANASEAKDKTSTTSWSSPPQPPQFPLIGRPTVPVPDDSFRPQFVHPPFPPGFGGGPLGSFTPNGNYVGPDDPRFGLVRQRRGDEPYFFPSNRLDPDNDNPTLGPRGGRGSNPFKPFFL